ncbi:ABC transporter permease [Kribbella solani]|uniref:ABC-2 type transport system permease protein n=1 Tax=Kribbella solani TaxID=236067 RepID=A0A841DH12_9ACTN|nr:ABC transporter permease subunit [Kribbella solani]MBB5978424.1 ABC-2 type transport system permease protein [Kribbella solani]
MSLVVFRQTLRQVRRTIGVLSLGAGVFFYLVLFASSSFTKDAPSVPFLQSPPKAMTAFLGGSADFFHPGGWLSLGMTHPVVLALLTSSALLVAAGSVATEIERGTIDLVLTRPVGRVRFLAAKAAASIVAVTAAEAGGLAAVLVARQTITGVSSLPMAAVLRAFAGSWLLFAGVAMVGLLVSAASSLRGRAIGITVGIVVGWFFLNFIALLIDGISGLRFASPFHYFRPVDLLGGTAAGGDLVVLAAIPVVAGVAAVVRFTRRDLTR